MSTLVNEILEELHCDMVSHGWLLQGVKLENSGHEPSDSQVTAVLKHLLMSENVEIGEAKHVRPDYVEFIAWRGTIEERLLRAKESVERASGPDKEFAYWLCLRKNVDRFEESS
jgi:hypothetical protein